jgi:hypothetical protein
LEDEGVLKESGSDEVDSPLVRVGGGGGDDEFVCGEEKEGEEEEEKEGNEVNKVLYLSDSESGEGKEVENVLNSNEGDEETNLTYSSSTRGVELLLNPSINLSCNFSSSFFFSIRDFNTSTIPFFNCNSFCKRAWE